MRHIVSELAFADVEFAQPALLDGLHSARPLIARYREVGEEERYEAPELPLALSYLDNSAGAAAWREGRR
jgi:hypothetical protein